MCKIYIVCDGQPCTLPVYEVQVEIIRVKVFQGLLDRGSGLLQTLVFRLQLGREEELRAVQLQRGQGGRNLGLVSGRKKKEAQLEARCYILLPD